MATFRKNTTKDGRVFYEIRVYTGKGQPRQTTRFFPEPTWSARTTERELQKAAAAFEIACRAGEHKARATLKAEAEAAAAAERAEYTFQRYAEEVWLPAACIGAAQATKRKYTTTLANWLNPAFGKLKLREIKAEDVERFLVGMLESGKAYATMQLCKSILNMVLEKARRKNLIEINPVSIADIPRQGKEEAHREPSAYTAAELVHIFSCLENEPLKWRLYVHLLADTGCRRGEACALQWKDIDGDRITIRHTLTTDAETGEILLTTPKSGKTRSLDIGPETLELLHQQRQAQHVAGIISPYVFTQEGSADVMFPSSPTRYFHTFGQRYDIPDFHPHKLRHSHASLALTSGADVTSVSERLGHADPSVTLKIYSHASQESIRRAGDIFREAIEQQKRQA